MEILEPWRRLGADCPTGSARGNLREGEFGGERAGGVGGWRGLTVSLGPRLARLLSSSSTTGSFLQKEAAMRAVKPSCRRRHGT